MRARQNASATTRRYLISRELLSGCGYCRAWCRCESILVAIFIAFAVTGAFVPVGAQNLPDTQAQALQNEKADRTPATAFYDIPSPLPPGTPGELIRSRPATDYTLPTGVHAIRILYHSRSAPDKDTAASGVVLLPAGSPPEGGWPVIVWAHGTSGVARICAPSMMKDVYYGADLFSMLRAGFAVVAVDYAGLGTEGPHQYLSADAEANDVIYGEKAAHAAVSHLSPRWVVDGHSQGGGAAWSVAQREGALRDPDFLGAVSVAGTVNMGWLIRYLADNRSDAFYAVFVAYGIKARFPQFNVADVLTAPALAQYRAMTTEGCWDYGYATQLSDLLGSSPVKPTFPENAWVRKFVGANSAFEHRPMRPLLILAGGADQSVAPQSIQEVVAKACRLGYRLEFRSFPGLDHDPVMEKSIPFQLSWIRGRFAGQSAPDNCAAIIDR